MIGMVIITLLRRRILQVQPVRTVAFIAEVAGSTTRGAVAFRFDTAARCRTETTKQDSALLSKLKLY